MDLKLVQKAWTGLILLRAGTRNGLFTRYDIFC